jgi:hypothetical protein
MNLPKTFVIIGVGSLVRSLPGARPKIVKMMDVLASFLQEHGLTTRTLLARDQAVDDSFEIKFGDLTDEGFEVIKLGLDRWIGSTVDKGKDPANTKILENALNKVRSADK